MRNIINQLKKNKLFIQIFKFGIVGGIATLIDMSFLYVFKEICKFPIEIANTLSFSIAVIYNYIASTKWVFDVDKENSKRKFCLFIIFSIIGLIINDGIMYVLSRWTPIYYMISKIVATLFVMVFNFVTRKLFLETRHKK